MKADVCSCHGPHKACVTELLEGRQAPAIAATDYVRMCPEQVRQVVPMRYTVLGTDGYGRSDTRDDLRRHFEVDRHYVAQAAVAAERGALCERCVEGDQALRDRREEAESAWRLKFKDGG